MSLCLLQLAEMVNIHFLSLMEALQECNSTVLSKVSRDCPQSQSKHLPPHIS